MELLKYKYGEAMDKLKGGERENGSGSGGAASGSGWKGFQRDVLAAAAAAKGDDTNGAEVAGGGVESSDGSVEGEYYPGLLNAAGNLCFLNSVLQVRSHTLPSCPVLMINQDTGLTYFCFHSRGMIVNGFYSSPDHLS